jgi:thiosulfate/3-mercaptopyruvate sulfurtransferase
VSSFPQPLVSAEWLAAHLADVRVVDVRWYLDGRSGRAAYRAGHLPGAIWLDVDAELSAWASPAAGRHPLPRPEQFAAVLGRVGIAEGTPVVAYDDAGGSIAARLWWMLHVLGEPVAVLDGGLQTWSAPLDTELPDVTPVERRVRAWPAGRFMTANEVAATDLAVFDGRSAERYAHGDPAIDPRPGHIPGAHSAPWAANLGADGRLLPPAELQGIYAAAHGRGGVAYCGSGVTACLDLLAMELAGLDGTALYAGSWSQWASDPSRPVEEGVRSR